MATSPRGKRLAVALGIAAAATAGALGLFFWKPIAVRWHGWRLESDAGYLERVVAVPDPLIQEAVRSFVKTPEGKAAALRRYLALLSAGSPPPRLEALAIAPGRTCVVLWVSMGSQSRFLINEDHGFSSWGQSGSAGPGKDRTMSLQTLLGGMGLEDFELPEHPGLSFTLADEDRMSSWRIRRPVALVVQRKDSPMATLRRRGDPPAAGPQRLFRSLFRGGGGERGQ